MTQSGHAVAVQQFPKGQLIAETPGSRTGWVWEWPMAHIIPFEPSSNFGALRRSSRRFLSLTKRLPLLKNNKARAPRSTTRQRYLAQAEEYRFQAEVFCDPTTQARMLRLAAIYEQWATQADE